MFNAWIKEPDYIAKQFSRNVLFRAIELVTG